MVSIVQIRRTSVRLPKWDGRDSTKPQPPKRRADTNKDSGLGSDADLALELVRQRSTPAMFVLGQEDELLFSNEQADNIFKDLKGIPEEVQGFCRRIRTRALDAPFDTSGTDCAIFKGMGGSLYSFRGFLVNGQGDVPPSVMVLVEKVVERGSVNLKKARTQFGLSDREVEVAKLLSQGLCNKEIAAKLYISEYTVKGHLKNITRKVGAESRGSIVAILK